MNFLLAIVSLPFLLFLPGYVTARSLFKDSSALSIGEKIFIPLAGSILISVWIGLALAEFGWFSITTLLALVIAYSVVVWFVARHRWGEWSWRDARPDWIFLLLLALAVLLAAKPAEYILGGTDAGSYVDLGISIARSGGIAIHDSQVASLSADSGKQFFWGLINPFMLYKQVRLPGFFIADQPSGLVLPQFLHLYAVWLAVFDALFGFQLGLYATPLIGVLGSVAFYFVAKTLFNNNRNLARLAFFLLIILVPQFWFARYPVAEGMTQFLMLTGMFAFLRFSKSGAPTGIGLPLLAGVAFGEIFLTRADAVLLLVPIGIYALAVFFTRSWTRSSAVFLISFGLVFLHALVHIAAFAPNYIYFQYSHALRMKNIDKLLPGGLPSADALMNGPQYLMLGIGLVLFGLVALFIVDRIVQIVRKKLADRPRDIAKSDRVERGLRWLAVAVTVGLVVFAYFLWPHPTSWYAYVGGATPADRSANLIKLGWYFSPIGIALATLGAAVVILRDLNRQNVFFWGTGALFSFFYLEELYSNPHYIYTIRHYIPLVIPLFVLLAARSLEFLWNLGASNKLASTSRARLQGLGRVLAGGALALWLIYNFYAMGILDASRAGGIALRLPFVTSSTRLGLLRIDPFALSIVGADELGGAYDQMKALADRLPEGGVIIFSNNRDEPALLANPLYFLYGRDAFVSVFNQPNGDKIAAMIDAWRSQGRDVILAFGTNGGKMNVPGYDLEPLGDFGLDVPQWAFEYEYMPRAAWRVNLNFALYRAVAQIQAPQYPFTIDFGGDDYRWLVNGWLERAPEASSRWMGIIPAADDTPADPRNLVARLRVPVAGDNPILDLEIRARALRDGLPLTTRSGNNTLGSAPLSTEFSDYHFTLPRADLKQDGESYLIDLEIPATVDEQGRILGAELQRGTVTEK